MKPKAAIAMLDRQISKHGQSVFLRRGSDPQHSLKAFVRGYDPAEIVGLIVAGDRRVSFSPTGLGSFGLPEKGDAVVIAGRPGTVQDDVEPLHMGDVLVRVNARVRMT